jgi:hypothetical protein
MGSVSNRTRCQAVFDPEPEVANSVVDPSALHHAQSAPVSFARRKSCLGVRESEASIWFWNLRQ